MADLTATLSRIAKLIATAESLKEQGNEEASATYRNKAETLMQQYRIEEEQLIAQDPKSLAPIHEMWEICRQGSAFRSSYASIMRYVAEHTGVRGVFVNTQGGMLAFRAVGYEADIRFALLLWNAAHEAFQYRLDVRFDPNTPEREMIYRLRASGIERQRVARIMWGEERGSKASAHARVGSVYKEECATRGEEAVLNGKGIDLATFRKAYAQSFLLRFSDRLRYARNAAGEATGGLVLDGRKERVDEAFYQLFPHMRPEPETALDVREGTPIEREEEECQACKRTTSQTGKCKDHRPWRPTQAQINAWNRQEYSAAAAAGRTAGRAAADDVELAGVKRAKRLDS